MPAYQYRVLDANTGDVLHEFQLLRRVEDRDAVALERIVVPERLLVPKKALTKAEEMFAAYHRREQLHGSNWQRHSEFTPEQIKAAWNAPDIPLPPEPDE